MAKETKPVTPPREVSTPDEKRKVLTQLGMSETDIEMMLAVESGDQPDGDLIYTDEDEE